jgi:hypothetical protein
MLKSLIAVDQMPVPGLIAQLSELRQLIGWQHDIVPGIPGLELPCQRAQPAAGLFTAGLIKISHSDLRVGWRALAGEMPSHHQRRVHLSRLEAKVTGEYTQSTSSASRN